MKVLIIDDEDIFREDLAELLRQQGYECKTASNAEEGLALTKDFSPDIVLCDIVMPDKDGIEVLEEITQVCPETYVIMITAYGTLENAIKAFRKGVVDYITKPLLIEDVLQKIERIIEHKHLIKEVKFLRRKTFQYVGSLPLVGKSNGIKRVLEQIKEVAPTKSTVLITGETGTGKELVARAIHQIMDGSNELPFVAINCAGISKDLLESELFGHVRGAFTGAVKNKEGLLEIANNGILFLDEISEMPLLLQSKFLRVLEEREFFRVGGTSTITLKARIVASTNKDLWKLVNQGQFREDLFFRIAVYEIKVPPLRERRSDIPLLVNHFIKKFNKELNKNCLGASNEVMRRLLSYPWRGNVRELRNVIECAMIHCQRDYISLNDLPVQVTDNSEFSNYSDNLQDAMEAYEKEHIRRVLKESNGNKEQAASRLGIHPSTLYLCHTMADI